MIYEKLCSESGTNEPGTEAGEDVVVLSFAKETDRE
jgi:hypothetical protein